MKLRYVFEFPLEAYEVSIISNSGAFPRPAAVSAQLISLDPNTTFGFKEGGYQSFGHGSLFSYQRQAVTVA
jgi:hypothetical protein